MSRWAALALLCAACGGGPHLSNLRCRTDGACQDPENPFRLLLQVDFDDPSSTLAKGALELRVDDSTQQTVALGGIFAAQGVTATAQKGTLQFDQLVILDRVGQGQTFRASARATNGKGEESNEPGLTFSVKLGGTQLVLAEESR